MKKPSRPSSLQPTSAKPSITAHSSEFARESMRTIPEAKVHEEMHPFALYAPSTHHAAHVPFLLSSTESELNQSQLISPERPRKRDWNLCQRPPTLKWSRTMDDIRMQRYWQNSFLRYSGRHTDCRNSARYNLGPYYGPKASQYLNYLPL